MHVVGEPSEFALDVLEVVEQIPPRHVMTYGDIAELLGAGGARGVGNVMGRFGSSVPWWRVVRAGGLFPTGHEDQALVHYREEGTPLVGGAVPGGVGARRVDLAKARWEGPGD